MNLRTSFEILRSTTNYPPYLQRVLKRKDCVDNHGRILFSEVLVKTTGEDLESATTAMTNLINNLPSVSPGGIFRYMRRITPSNTVELYLGLGVNFKDYLELMKHPNTVNYNEKYNILKLKS